MSMIATYLCATKFMEETNMVRKLSKTMAIFAVVMVMAVSVLSVNAFAAAPGVSVSQDRDIVEWWLPLNGLTEGYGTVTGLIKGRDTGITFRCTTFTNIGGRSDFNAYGEILNRQICMHPYDKLSGVSLTYAGDDGVDLFNDNWFDVTGGMVGFKMSLRNFTPGAQQYVDGIAL